MGSGADSDTDETDGQRSSNSILGANRSRRSFLAIVIATITGLLATAAVSLQAMFGYFTPETDGQPEEQPGVTEEIEDDDALSPGDIFVHEYANGYRVIGESGSVLHSGSDGQEMLNEAIRTAPPDGKLFVRGQYELSSPLVVEKSLRLVGEGARVELLEDAHTAIEFAGSERYTTELAGPVEPGSHTLELARTRDIEKGDLILLEDAGGPGVLGRGQPAGEPHTVLDVDGSTVTIEDTVVWRDGYKSGTVAYVIDPIEVTCRGFDFDAPAKDESYVGVFATACQDSTFADLSFDKFGSRAVALEACGDCRIRDCRVLQSADIEAGDGYGFQIRAGCHDILVEGCTAKECRHPLSVTPAGPREVASRSVLFRDCFLSSNGSAAINCHGGAAHDVRFESCIVHTWGYPGVRTGAMKTSVAGCEFRMQTHHAVTTRNDGQGMEISVTDTDIYGAGSAVMLDGDSTFEFNPSWQSVHLDSVRANGCYRFFVLNSGAIDRVEKLVISNSTWDEVEQEGIRIENRVDSGTITGNDFGDAPNAAHIRARENDETDLNKLQITSNRFERSEMTTPFIRLTDSRECVVSENTFYSEAPGAVYADNSGSTHNMIKQNTVYAPGAGPELIEADGDSVARENHFFDYDSEDWV